MGGSPVIDHQRAFTKYDKQICAKGLAGWHQCGHTQMISLCLVNWGKTCILLITDDVSRSICNALMRVTNYLFV